MLTGKVCHFSNERGYGFLTRDDGEVDVFVHFSAIECQEGYKRLDKGDRVQFEIEIGPKGKPQAAQVRVVQKAEVA